MNKVFLYGTLRPVIKGKVVPVSYYLPGFIMRDLEHYPCAEASANVSDRIYGVVCEVPDAGLSKFDFIEGTKKGLFNRQEIEVVNIADESIKQLAWVYTAGPAMQDVVPTYPVIPSGDWYKHKLGSLYNKFLHQ